MKKIITSALSIVFGFSSGVILATGILAFITAIGIIPRLTEKTGTRTHYLAVGTASVLGITAGSLFTLWDIHLYIPNFLIGLFSLFMGMFIGCLAVALAEVLNVMPIAKKRMRLKKGIWLMIVFFSLGKMVGSLYYWFYPGFN